jgi:signal transduction histidine kinase
VRRRIPIRTKLAAALAIPIAALLSVSVLEVAQSSREADKVRDQTELATSSIGPSGLITGLQNERNYGSVWLLGFEGALELPVKSFEEATANTDAAIANFKDEIEAKGGDVAETFGPVIEEIDREIQGYRQIVTGFSGERGLNNTPTSEPFFNGYTALIDRTFQASGRVALAIDDATLRRGVELTDLASHQIEVTARLIRAFLLAGVTGMLDTPEEIGEASGLLGQLENNMATIHQLAIGRYEAPAAKAEGEVLAAGVIDLSHQAIDTAGTEPVPVSKFTASVSRKDDEGWNGFRTAVNEEIERRAGELNDDAARSRQLYMALALLAVAVAVLVTWLVSRSITRPLRSLTRQAKEMAERRLPEAVVDILETPLGDDVTVPSVEPVRVNTRDEVSDVADALNTVQDSALDLAVEQAVLRRNIADSFVNLGRRNQNLLGRQLDFITELETNETNADTLANLFRLDHLATRMRRNAESLLVLAGIEPPRQWAAPVRLTDVIRAALGEVEDYQRVTVRGVEPATVLGSAAADLAHLLAELIENALVFSPPDQTVDIRGRSRPDGYTLAIIDSGLGMPAADVAAANRRLAGTESFTIAPSKYLGHYVAGNLAARHDINVRLDNSPGNGITATIDLPMSLLTADAAIVDDVPVSLPRSPMPLAPAGDGGSVAEAPLFDLPSGGSAVGAGSGNGGGGSSPWASLGPVTGQTPAARAPGPAEQPTRTASGLVKRARRGSDREAPAASVPSDLLASLASVTDNNVGNRAPGERPPGVEVPDGVTPPPIWSALSTRNTGRTTIPPANRSWTAPAAPPAPPGPEGPAGPGAPPGRPPLAGRPAPGGPPEGGQTSSGLARRVRGAQMPVTQPLNLRRPQEHPQSGGGGYRRDDRAADGQGHMRGYGNWNGNANSHSNGHNNGHGNRLDGAGDQDESSAARTVYGFLTSFTQGVQRGLDEARRDPNTPKENS